MSIKYNKDRSLNVFLQLVCKRVWFKTWRRGIVVIDCDCYVDEGSIPTHGDSLGK